MSDNASSRQLMKPFKVVFLGLTCVGKTSIVRRFVEDCFASDYEATIGIDFVSKTLYLKDDRTIRLQIWDTAGMERFRCLTPSYIRASHVIVIAFDVTSRQSYDEVPRFIHLARTERGEDAMIIIVGNKIDKSDLRTVSKDEGRQLANKEEARYLETSAKSGFNIKELFELIADFVPPEPLTGDSDEEGSVDIVLTRGDDSESGGCRC